jgi:isocitrate lyase
VGKPNPHANRGVPRNKKPLQNILYKFEERGGKFFMLWAYERHHNTTGGAWNFHGSVTEEEIKARLTVNQWSKFRQGVRTFVHQRRIGGRNVPIPSKQKPEGAAST